MKTQKLLSIAVTCLLILGIAIPMQAQKNKKPNIVLINMDNFGYGELGFTAGVLSGVAPRRASTSWPLKGCG